MSYILKPECPIRGLLVASLGHFSEKGCVSVASWAAQGQSTNCVPGHFSRITVVYQAVEGQSISCVPRSLFSCNSCVSVVSHVTGVKMEPVKVATVIRSEKGKELLVIKGF